MSKYIAVKGCELKLDHGNGIIKIDTQPSNNVKVDGNGCYMGTINISVEAFDSLVVTVPKSGSGKGTITGTATKVKINENAVVLENDVSLPITIKGDMYTDKGTAPTTDIVTVTISKAGQTKVKGE